MILFLWRSYSWPEPRVSKSLHDELSFRGYRDSTGQPTVLPSRIRPNTSLHLPDLCCFSYCSGDCRKYGDHLGPCNKPGFEGKGQWICSESCGFRFICDNGGWSDVYPGWVALSYIIIVETMIAGLQFLESHVMWWKFMVMKKGTLCTMLHRNKGAPLIIFSDIAY